MLSMLLVSFSTLVQVSQRVDGAALARKQLKGPLEFRVLWLPRCPAVEGTWTWSDG